MVACVQGVGINVQFAAGGTGGITVPYFNGSTPPNASCAYVLLTQNEHSALVARVSALETSDRTLSLDSTSDPERVADMASLFYAFLAVLVVVWGVKQLLNLFTGDTER